MSGPTPLRGAPRARGPKRIPTGSERDVIRRFLKSIRGRAAPEALLRRPCPGRNSADGSSDLIAAEGRHCVKVMIIICALLNLLTTAAGGRQMENMKDDSREGPRFEANFPIVLKRPFPSAVASGCFSVFPVVFVDAFALKTEVLKRFPRAKNFSF